MARLDPGYVFTTNERVTPAKFHSMVDDAFIKDTVVADLTAIRLIYTATPGSPTAGDVRVGTTGEFEFYNGATWVTQPPELLQLTLTNKSGSNLILGDVVVADPANSASFTIATDLLQHNVIGVLAADIANNASGLVNVRGVCNVRCNTSAGPNLLRGPIGTSANPDIRVAAEKANSGKSDVFGIALTITASSGATTLEQCYIWK